MPFRHFSRRSRILLPHSRLLSYYVVCKADIGDEVFSRLSAALSTWGLMLSLFASEAAADVEAEDVLVRSGYYVICCLRRHSSEIIFSARFVQEFVDICVQDVSRDTRRTLDVRRFFQPFCRDWSYICIMTQGFIDAGWADCRN